MKTLLFTLSLSLFLSLPVLAQNHLNMEYLTEVSQKNSSSNVSKFQNMVSKYNIQETQVFSSEKSHTYDVVFAESNCNVEATYNSDGKIIKSSETYRDIKIPSKLSLMINENHPEWSVFSSEHNIDYNHLEGASFNYMIKIKKNKRVKVLKFKQTKLNNANDFIALK